MYDNERLHEKLDMVHWKTVKDTERREWKGKPILEDYECSENTLIVNVINTLHNNNNKTLV